MSELEQAKYKVIAAALAIASSEAADYFRTPGAWDAASAEYNLELLALASREFVEQVNKMDKDQRPVGWDG